MLDRELQRQKKLPGPGAYPNSQKEMKDDMHLAKSMLGGKLEEKQLVDNGVPGPATYQNILVEDKLKSIPGFKIMQDTSKSKTKDEDKNRPPVGPEKYNPENYYMHVKDK